MAVGEGADAAAVADPVVDVSVAVGVIDDAVRVVPLLIPLDGLRVAGENAEPYQAAIVNIIGFGASNCKSDMVQHVVFVLLIRFS
jgi:hypothetical protein